MHPGLNWPFVPHVNQRSPEAPLKFQMAPKLREPCTPNKVPDGPDTWFPIILWVQKEGTQMCLSEVKASLRLKT
jgi:hypothetical protein